MRVLIIEDNPGDARLIQEMLKGGSFETASVSDLAQAARHLGSQSADVVLLDLGLPESFGLETLTRAQACIPQLPIVVMTSVEDMETALQAVARGAEDYLIKGRVDPALLRRSLAYSIERKRMETALRRSEELYRRIVETTSEGIAITNEAGKIAFANSRFACMVGYQPEEVLDRELRSFLGKPQEAAPPTKGRIGAVASPGELRLLRKDGREVWVHASVSAIPDKPGELFMLADITTHKAAEADLARYRDHLELLVRERTAELQRLNESLSREVSVRKDAEEELRALSRRLFRAQEEERRSIAIELHDQIGQMVTGLLYVLEGAERLEPEQGAHRIRTSREIATELVSQVRNLSRTLRPSGLEEMGLVRALQSHCKQFTEQTGIAVDLAHEDVPETLGADLSIAAFRIVQEALTNAARHAGAAVVTVRLTGMAGRLDILVEDPGKGFDLAAVQRSTGLSGMRERAALLGGRFVIDSVPGRGTRVVAELPLGHAAELPLDRRP